VIKLIPIVKLKTYLGSLKGDHIHLSRVLCLSLIYYGHNIISEKKKAKKKGGS
jgi:hypothetical protein